MRMREPTERAALERTLRRVRDSSGVVSAFCSAVRRIKTRRSWISCVREERSSSERSVCSALWKARELPFGSAKRVEAVFEGVGVAFGGAGGFLGGVWGGVH